MSPHAFTPLSSAELARLLICSLSWTTRCQDMSGSVEVGELVPVIFNKASSPQHNLIRHLIEYENATVSRTHDLELWLRASLQ